MGGGNPLTPCQQVLVPGQSTISNPNAFLSFLLKALDNPRIHTADLGKPAPVVRLRNGARIPGFKLSSRSLHI